MLVSLRPHFEAFELLSDELTTLFISEVQKVAATARKVLGADRINVAILGNQEPHVHAHIVPRYGAVEPVPHKSPWDDPRQRVRLQSSVRQSLIDQLSAAMDDKSSFRM